MTDYHDILRKMQAIGLIETPAWPRPAAVSKEDRRRLAELLSVGDPLFETIIADRDQPVT